MNMVHRQRDQLAQRQQQLLIRSAELRVALAHQAQALQAPLALADQARAAGQWLRHHPLWPLAALALLALRRPRRVLGWVSGLSWGWRLYRRGVGWLSRAAAQHR